MIYYLFIYFLLDLTSITILVKTNLYRETKHVQ